MSDLDRRRVLQLSALAGALTFAGAASAQNGGEISLFKVVSVKDDIVIGLTSAELDQLGGRDAGAIARSLSAKGTLTVWQYAVRKGQNGDLQQAPLHKIGLIAHDSLRVEPYKSPLKVLPHD
jgi:hypothetical protein